MNRMGLSLSVGCLVTMIAVHSSLAGSLSWTRTKDIRNEPQWGAVYDMALSDNGNIFAAIYDADDGEPGEVFGTSDGGSSWWPTQNIQDVGSVISLLAASDGYLYAGTWRNPGSPNVGHIVRSNDNGVNWVSVLDASAPEESISVITQTSTGTFYAGTIAYPSSDPSGQIYKSSDGESWDSAGLIGDSDNPGARVRDILEGSNGALYAAAGDGAGFRVFKTTDAGAHWDSCGAFPNALTIESLVEVSEDTQRVLYAGGRRTDGAAVLFRSEDWGENWAGVSLPGAGAILDLMMASDGYLYAGTGTDGEGKEGGVYRTRDSGASWEKVSTWDSTVDVFSLLELPNGVIYAGTGDYERVYRTPEPGTLVLLALGGAGVLGRVVRRRRPGWRRQKPRAGEFNWQHKA